MNPLLDSILTKVVAPLLLGGAFISMSLAGIQADLSTPGTVLAYICGASGLVAAITAAVGAFELLQAQRQTHRNTR